ncbi:hypothetical protein RDWZM_001151 [Blomia tropicalis]|uniref:Uncharacterized protein n=1 Tax=Blomia tropicalis TaxID=40697 RepID=A0A9Q0RQC5_BLOTA|nr:hypothetical protein RDWZM_001151 [Blomia tropicalis]
MSTSVYGYYTIVRTDCASPIVGRIILNNKQEEDKLNDLYGDVEGLKLFVKGNGVEKWIQMTKTGMI